MRISWFFPLTAAAALSLSAGCASPVLKPQVVSLSGEYRSPKAQTEKARETEEGSADDVKVIVDQLLPGMEFKDGVFTTDPARFEVLGKVAVEPASGFPFYPYRESWRKPVCWSQNILLIGTLFIWAVVPTSWPCFVGSGDPDETRAQAHDAMKRAAKVLGANLILVDGSHHVAWAIRAKAETHAPPAPPAGAARL
jgi:hypothetical protein